MIDEVSLRVWRNDQEGQTRAEGASPLRMQRGGIDARQREVTIAALSSAIELVHGGGGLVHDRRHLMVVPAVRIVICDHDCSRGPEFGLLEGVDGIDDKGLLVEWIGIAGVTVLIAGRLEEYDGWQV